MRLTTSKNKRRVLIGSLVAVVGSLGVYKAISYSAEPKIEFGCKALDNPTDKPSEGNFMMNAVKFIWKQLGGAINDASCIDATQVHGVVAVRSEDDVRAALEYAKEHDLAVSIAGVRHSMGGHTVSPGGMVLDMMNMNQIVLDESAMTVRVGSGATWHQIQNALHPHYAVSAMQSTDIFSVGGSISVNAHGMDHHIGAVENTIRWLRVMLPNGNVVRVSRNENRDLYELVVGGYGLFGIILEAELDIVPNDIYQSKRHVMSFSDFPQYYDDHLANNEDIGLMYTHLSIAPNSLLEEAIVYEYHKQPVTSHELDLPPLAEISSVKLRRFIMNLSKTSQMAQQLRWWAEKYLEPRFESCTVSRNEAIGSGEACFVSRNEPMHDSVPYLYNNLTNETDILHEYFIPREHIVSFVDELRALVRENDINLLNASVRVVNKERGMLTYAPTEAFSVVLFINQKISAEGNEKMGRDTQAIIDLAHKYDGKFFLPYQLHYTDEQLRESYPNIDEFIAAKKRIDPDELIQSRFYHHLTGQKS